MEYTIKIEQVFGFPCAVFTVSVCGDTETTTHRVMVREPYYEKLTHGEISSYGLIKRSFEFLLERESPASVLSSFDLERIAYHFPEYEESMKQVRSVETH